MHKVFVIGNGNFFNKNFETLISEEGFKPVRYKSLSQSLSNMVDASVLIIDNVLSSDPGFRDFLKKTENVPRIIIDNNGQAKGIFKWLKNNLTYPALNPSGKEIVFFLKKAVHDRRIYTQFEEIENSLINANKELHLLEEVSKTLTSALDLHSIIDTIMTHIVERTNAKAWSLFLLDDESNKLYLEKTHRKRMQKRHKIFLEPGEGVAGWVAREGVPVIIPDTKAAGTLYPNIQQEGVTEKKSIICVPLKSKGEILGVLEIIDKKKGLSFTKDDLEIILKLVDHASLAIERAALYQKMAELAITDDLTKLFNSRYLNRTIEAEISRSERHGSSVSLIFMDIDYFKNINDHYGHLAGSKVLVEMGQLLIKDLRSIDIVSRYGGDEFVIVLPQTPPMTASQIAERLRRSIGKHVFLREEGQNLKLTASFGVASYPESATSKDELLHLADEAMYKVKNRTRDGVYTISVAG